MKDLSVQPARRLTIVLLLLFALLVCIRMPQIVIKGRFWAEEGNHFFTDAWSMPPLAALLNPFGGYLNLVANAATLGARWLVPLELAPYFTIGVALLVQLLPPLLLLTARDPWLQNPFTRCAGAFLLLLVPASEEIWLQTLHCQFELTLCCALILCLQTTAGVAGAGRVAILFLAPLCGPGAIALMPLFLLRVAGDRSAARLFQALALAAGSAIQILLFLTPAATRAYALDPSILLCIFTVRHVALPFLGRQAAESIASSLRAGLSAGRESPWAIIAPLLVFGVAGAFSLARPERRPAFWFLAAGLLVALVSYFGAIGPPANMIDTQFGERYAFVPEALFGMTLLALAASSTSLASAILWLLVAWKLIVGIGMFDRPWLLVADGPAWRPEVAAWRAHRTVTLGTWPTGWRLTLPPSR